MLIQVQAQSKADLDWYQINIALSLDYAWTWIEIGLTVPCLANNCDLSNVNLPNQTEQEVNSRRPLGCSSRWGPRWPRDCRCSSRLSRRLCRGCHEVRGAFTLKIIVTKFKGLNHLRYWSNWGHMKALTILLQMRYGSLLWSSKWLCANPKCWAHLLDLSATQKYACKINFY